MDIDAIKENLEKRLESNIEISNYLHNYKLFRRDN